MKRSLIKGILALGLMVGFTVTPVVYASGKSTSPVSVKKTVQLRYIPSEKIFSTLGISQAQTPATAKQGKLPQASINRKYPNGINLMTIDEVNNSVVIEGDASAVQQLTTRIEQVDISPVQFLFKGEYYRIPSDVCSKIIPLIDGNINQSEGYVSVGSTISPDNLKQFHAILNAAGVNTIFSPNLVTINQVAAQLKTGSSAEEGGSGGPGFQVDVTPGLEKDGTVLTDLKMSINEPSGSVKGVPIFDSRVFQATYRLSEGEAVVSLGSPTNTKDGSVLLFILSHIDKGPVQ